MNVIKLLIMGEIGVGIGGLADVRENYTTSRYNHYAPYTFEEEVVDTQTFTYYPQSIGAYNGSIPIVFQIGAEVDWYTKLKTDTLHGTIKVFNITTNAAPASTENWSLVNNYCHSLFSNISTKIGEHEIVDSSRNPYPYKAYFENVLVPTKFYSDTVMSADGFYKDVDQTADKGTSTSFAARRKDIATGGKKGLLSLLILHSNS